MRGLLLMIIGLVLGTGYIHAQQEKEIDLTKRLYLGDTFVAPSTVQLMGGHLKTVNWKALEDKVVLLEFFDTYCGNCIEAMPKLQELRDQYSDQFEVILVGWQDRPTIQKLFSSNAYLQENKVNLPVIYADTNIKRLFPHRSVPHAVLLYKGKVQAITTTGFITAPNILKLYKEGNIRVPLKDDFGKRELGESQKKMGVTIMDYQDGIPYRSWTFEKDSTNGIIKSSMYNASLFTALKALASKARLQQSLYIPRMDRVVWKVSDSARYYNFSNDPYWDIENKICYERFDTIARVDSAQARMVLKDFEGFLGIKVYSGMKRMQVMELSPTVVKAYVVPNGQKAAVYLGTAAFAGMTDYSERFPPIVDLVKSDIKMEIYPYKNLEELNTQLAAYGIKAEYGSREIEVLVIEELSEI